MNLTSCSVMGGQRVCCHLLSVTTVALLLTLTARGATRARIKVIKNGRLLAATGRMSGEKIESE